MPLTEQTVKKIWFIGFVALAVIGALFMVFAFFFNRGTLTVISASPYTLTVPRVKTEICTTDTCSVVLAPGDYEVTLSKTGYRDITRTVTVPIGGELKEEMAFAFVPTLGLKGNESELKIFALPTVTGDDLPTEGVYYENNYLAYVERDPATRRQTLYVRTIKDGKPGEKTAVTSFIRDLKTYTLVTAIEEKNKIALIDSTAGTSTLYMIDLAAKSRAAMFTYPLIAGLKWLPGTEDFLFEAREGTTLATNIFVYSSQPQKLALSTSIKNVIPVSKDRLIAATGQYIADADKLGGLEGGTVTLGEAQIVPVTLLTEKQATPDAAIGNGNASAPAFVDYSLIDQKARLLKAAPDLAYPAEAKLSETKKSVYFLVDGKVYELQFID